MALNVDAAKLQKLPKAARIALEVAAVLVVLVPFVFLSILPKHKQIGALKQQISAQEKDIAKKQSMAAQLDELKAKNAELKAKLKELEEQLPEEKEISSLLRQVSDLGLESGLQILQWRPAQRRKHASGVVFEIPVTVSMKGSYHKLGTFFAKLTRLNRIVNISNIQLGSPKLVEKEAELSIGFSAVTFTAVSEGGLAK